MKNVLGENYYENEIIKSKKNLINDKKRLKKLLTNSLF